MKDKIYVVLSEWESPSDDFNCEVIGVFYNMREAVACLKTERDTILRETYNTSFNRCEGVTMIGQGERHVSFFSESDCCRNSLTIYEKEIKRRDFIAIQFKYAGEVFNERIYLDQIDLTHYDNVWDWWFGSNGNKQFPNLNFELTSDKDQDGNPTCGNMYINVYKNDEAMTPLQIITDVSYSRSWAGKKITKYD